MRLLLILAAILLTIRCLALEVIQLISTGPGELTYPTSLNDHGAVTGFSFRPQSNLYYSWMWANGQFYLLPEKSATRDSLALAINNLGQVAGTAVERSRERTLAVTWHDGAMTILPNPTVTIFDQSEAADLNDSGEIVGTSWRIDLIEGKLRYMGLTVVWQNNQVVRIAPFYSFLSNTGQAINKLGEVAGMVENRATGQETATRWDRNYTTYDVKCSDPSLATGLNELGSVVGTCIWGIERGFYADGSCGLDLGGPANMTSCRPEAINNSNVVVGTLTFPGNLKQAFRWQNQAMEILKVTDPAWQLLTASDLNQSGQIVGSAYYNGRQVGYLLTPVPEPTVLVGLLLPLAVLARKRRN